MRAPDAKPDLQAINTDLTRIALISDVHGNIVALDAVLEDCHDHNVDRFWFLGDYVAIGPEPVAVLERINDLDHSRVIRGNTDRYVVTGEGPPPTLEAVRRDPSLLTIYTSIAESFAWTRGFITGAGWYEWMAGLPLELRAETPGGTRVLAVHASPGQDDGEGVHRGRSNQELRSLIAEADADIVFVGHTHEPMIRRIEDVYVVNLGSVGNPQTKDPRASYVLLDVSDSFVEFLHRRVDYDREEFIERVHRSRHPSAEYILSFQRGEQCRRDSHPDHVPMRLGVPTRLTT